MWATKYKTCVPEYDIFCQTYVHVLYFDITCFEIRLSLRILKNSLFLLTIFLFSTILKILNWLLMTQKKQSMSTIDSYHWNQTKFHHRFLKGNQRRNGQPQNFSLKFSVSVKELSGFLHVVYTKNRTLFLLKILSSVWKLRKSLAISRNERHSFNSHKNSNISMTKLFLNEFEQRKWTTWITEFFRPQQWIAKPKSWLHTMGHRVGKQWGVCIVFA